jgi:uncharacterized membrane protein
MTSTDDTVRGGRPLTAAAWVLVWFLIIVVLVFLVIRVVSDVGNLSTGVVPPEGDFNRRYALNPGLAYLRIVPGLIYLLGAPFQFSQRFRSQNYRRHRRLGLVLLTSGAVTGVFAISVGVVMPFGRFAEATATVLFGGYFLIALYLAFAAIRSGDVAMHRRWMIRAFAIGVGVGVIRIVVGVGEAFGIGIASSFGAAFWIAFSVMAFLGEVWLRLRPNPPSRERLAG